MPTIARKRQAALVLALVLLLLVLAAVRVAIGRGQDRSLRRIRESGVLVVALEASYPPFEATDGQGNFGGFDVDLGREIARRLGVEVHFANIAFDSLYDALYNGKADVIISGLRYEAERTRDVTYSAPYLDAGQVAIVRAADSITRTLGLAGRRVGVENASEGAVEAGKLAARTPGMIVQPYNSPQEAVAALHGGVVDAAVTDYVTALGIAQSDPTLRLLLPPFAADPLVVAANVHDRAMMNEINRILKSLRSEGWLDRLAQSDF